ncbi:MAG: adenine phosphoribosyltransferase [Elusimicrobia bacterium RIFOXYA2_FULL_40_6]|nr:MAG: adenine phosphoribosyltransferase [Elusimicrobia bacterium RIFOXYA2_FULL_40_6]
MDLKKIIRDVPDFPKKGVIFKDITPLLGNKEALKQSIDQLTANYKNKQIDKIVSMESRGFILGSALAYTLGCGFVPVRKKNKLPWQTVSITYDLEYGTDTLEMHKDACSAGENILIVDDVLATGGTALAVTKIIENLGAKVTGLCFLIELSFLNPRKKLEGREIFSLLTY